jgi:hypothetical protein
MKKIHLRYVAPLMLGVLFGIDCTHPQSAQSKPIFLANLSCVQHRGYLWETEIEEVILNREIYTTRMSTTRSWNLNGLINSEFSCKLPNAKSAELDFLMAVKFTQRRFSPVNLPLLRFR